MKIDDIFLRKRKKWNTLIQKRKQGDEKLISCSSCKEPMTETQWKEHLSICPNCNFCMPMSPEDRIDLICDDHSFRELFEDVKSRDPLKFPGYPEKLSKCRDAVGREEAFTAGVGKIRQIRAAIGILDGRFLMGSMGTAVGEKIVRLTEYAEKKKLPLILFSASGGARMQEGLFSLMQMARTASAVERFKESGGLFISVLTNPTTGGVSASFASLGDIILAEPDALICFAGPRVIEQTIGQKLPEGFQHAEFLLEHGMIDRIVKRDRLQMTLHHILRLHERP